MLFPISGVEIHPLIPFFVAFIISFFTAMGGVSGAFLILPFQVSILGYTAPSVSATNQVFNIVATPGGVYRYIKEGRMLWPLVLAVVIGTLPGVFTGAWIRIRYLPEPGNFRLFMGFVLFYIGIKLLTDLIKRKKKPKPSAGPEKTSSQQIVKIIESSIKKVKFDYNGEKYEFSPPAVYAVCFIVGIIGGIYGIGGGAIAAPFFVAILGLPVYTVAGASLLGTFITSVAGVVFYQYLSTIYTEIAIAPDWFLGALFGAGGFFGMYAGAMVQKYVPEGIIKSILCCCVLFVAIRYIAGYF